MWVMNAEAIYFNGGILITYGLFLMIGRKIFLRRLYDSIIVFIIVSSNPILNLVKLGNIKYEYIFSIFILMLPMIGLIYYITKGRYSIYNIKSKLLSDTLKEILNENKIVFEEQKNALLLKDWDDKQIEYKYFLNTVELNTRDILDLPFLTSMLSQLKSRIKNNKTKVFPVSGVFFILLGLIYMIILLLISDKM